MQADATFRIDGVSLASKTDGERVPDQHSEVVSRECTTPDALTTQHWAETTSPFHSTSSYEVGTTATTNLFEDAVASQRQECQGRVATARADTTKPPATGGISAAVTQDQIQVSKLDEDTSHRRIQQQSVTSTFLRKQATLSAAAAMQCNVEEVSNTFSPVLSIENTTILSHSGVTESHGSSVVEHDKQVEPVGPQYTRRVDGSYEPRSALPS